MQINVTTKYAILIVLYLSNNRAGATSKEIGKEIGISAEFVQNIVRKLRINKNLIDVTRGTQGGYTLAKNPESITLLDILTAMDDDVMISKKKNGEDIGDDVHVIGGKEHIINYYEQLQKIISNMLETNIMEILKGEFDVLEKLKVS